MSRFCVYARYVREGAPEKGKEQFVNEYPTVKEAIEKIAANYKLDKDLRQLGEYFYFYKER